MKKLIKALEEGKIQAAVDVVCDETDIANNVLIEYAKTHDNIMITPHIAGLTFDSQKKAMQFVVDQLENIYVT